MARRTETITSFYDAIAGQYDAFLTDHDAKARKVIAQVFKETVPRGVVLDFGGGTGLDLPWLQEHYSTVLFLEPSLKMRGEARKKMTSSEHVRFVDQDTDFTEWSEQRLPFPEKVDGILANFAVLNCIENMPAFFEKLALVTSRQCHLVAALLDPHVNHILKKNSVFSALRILVSDTLTIHHQREGVLHKTFVHTLRKLKNASSPYFDMLSSTAIPSSDFVLVIFARK
ncbi:class I SAM-dependent methyltransferase [Chryseolinea soli]|uniref:Class I SAM-dependent methyltransferase n=1 Tax=Chryseolinea soli TaxID=2321403 RepID=A0A385SJN8_9BACT|nr:class I SAM-dependent methyltransferase [Chryseolinea soli]AYB31164.1 class I SAM-dependent methyltransferase [Chryseolinea soli]